MSDLLVEVLFHDEANIFDEVLRWLLHLEHTVPWKNTAVTHFEFAKHLLTFVYQHTYPLMTAKPARIEEKSVEDVEEHKKNELNSTLFGFLGVEQNPAILALTEKLEQRIASKPLESSDLFVEDVKLKDDKKHASLLTVRINQINKADGIVVKKLTPKKFGLPPQKRKREFLQVHKIVISKIARLVSAVITSNLTQNLLYDLRCLFDLLIVDPDLQLPVKSHMHGCYDRSNLNIKYSCEEETCLFKLGFEAVHFAAMVLQDQSNILLYLGDPVLKSLTQIPAASHLTELVEKIKCHFRNTNHDNVSQFDTTFTKLTIADYPEQSLLSESENSIIQFRDENSSTQYSEIVTMMVSLEADSDTSSESASDASIDSFQQLQLTFNELFDDWKEFRKKDPSAEFFIMNIGTVRSLITDSIEDDNLYLFADLFVSEILTVLNKNTDEHEKMHSKDGLTTADRSYVQPYVISSAPEKRFPGALEFFKDFIRATNSANFSSCLRDVLLDRICALNRFSIICDVNDTEEKDELFLSRIDKLCLLAKFLSLIVFLSYHDSDYVPPAVRARLDKRRKYPPPLHINILNELRRASANGQLIVTIPWIVEYLMGMDRKSVRSPWFRSIFVRLQLILEKVGLPGSDNQANIMLQFSAEEIRSMFSQMDMVEQFRVDDTDAYRIPLSKIESALNEGKGGLDQQYAKRLCSTVHYSQLLITLYIHHLFNNLRNADRINQEADESWKVIQIYMNPKLFIGGKALFKCCPELQHLGELLKGEAEFSPLRIKVDSEKDPPPRPEIPPHIMNDWNKFSNLSGITKGCVRQVSEISASNFVKLLCETTFPQLEENVKGYLEKLVKVAERGKEIDIMRVVEKMLRSLYFKLKRDVDTLHRFEPDVSMQLCIPSMISWQASDQNEIDLSVRIGIRKCKKDVWRFIVDNFRHYDLIYTEIKKLKDNLTKIMDEEHKLAMEKIEEQKMISKKTKKVNEWLKETDQNRTIFGEPSPASVIDSFQKCIQAIMEWVNVCDVSVITISNLLSDTVNCLNSRLDFSFEQIDFFLKISTQLCTVTIFHRPKLLSPELLVQFNEIWNFRRITDEKLSFDRMLIGFGLRLFVKKLDEDYVLIRKTLTMVLIFLIENELLSESELVDQINSTYGKPWPRLLMQQLVQCLDDVQSDCVKCGDELRSEVEYISSFLKDPCEV